MPDQAPLPLAGVRVIDLTRVMTGPFATMMLADLGADVIKVEVPGKGDDTRGWGPPFQNGESTYFISINRNKRSIALNLKDERACEALWKLVDSADVLVENFSPGTADRLGFGYEAVKARNPTIIYASISGFGQTGPSRNRTAYDLIVQGMSGMMSITGEPDAQPTKLGVPIADIGAGMFCAYAVSAALYGRTQTGIGQYIDVSMLGGQVAMLTYQAGIYFATGEVPGQLGNSHPIVAPYDTFKTSDGYVNIAVGNDSLWQRFCRAFNLDEVATDGRYLTNAGRITSKAAVYEIVNAALGTVTTQECVALLDRHGVPCGPINRIDEVFADPQTVHAGLQLDFHHPKAGDTSVAGFPYKFSETPLSIRNPAPLLGEHSRQILKEAGYSETEIEELINAGAVAESDN